MSDSKEKIEKRDLSYLGEDFQFKLTKVLVEFPRFFQDLYNILDQNMFTESLLRIFIGVMKEYYNKYEITPSYQIMEIQLRDRAKTKIEAEQYLALIKKLKDETSLEGFDDVKEKSANFFKLQSFAKFAIKLMELTQSGNHEQCEECVEAIDAVKNLNTQNEFGKKLFDELDDTLTEDFRVPIPTGIKNLDAALEGGIGKGQLGVIVCPSGMGKTTLTTAMASHAVLHKCESNNYEGFKVIQIVFEDGEKQIKRKHYARLTEIEAKDLSKSDNIDGVREYLTTTPLREAFDSNYRLKKFLSGETSVSDIKRYLKQECNGGFVPDLVVIDYFECLEIERGTENEWKRETKTMRKLESMASELNIGIWVPVQGGKDSFNAEVVTQEKASGSVGKIQVAHIVLTISRSLHDLNKNLATISILKNRSGKAGMNIYNLYFNNGTCIINDDGSKEFDDLMELKTQVKFEHNKSNQATAKEVFARLEKKKSEEANNNIKSGGNFSENEEIPF